MDDGRAERAVFRIETALARLEAAAERARASTAGLEALRVRHARLRGEVEAAVSALDQLANDQEDAD